MTFAARKRRLAVLFCCLAKLCLMPPSRVAKKETSSARCEREGKERERRIDNLLRSLKAAYLGKSLLSMTAAVNMAALIVARPAPMIQSCRKKDALRLAIFAFTSPRKLG